MTLYTGGGDQGRTSLYSGGRLSKSALRIEAYGLLDELSSFLGLVVVKMASKQESFFLRQIQKDLYKIMGVLGGAGQNLSYLGARVKEFEKKIDKEAELLPELNRFILPGSTELSCWFHILRSICRRAERGVVRYFDKVKIESNKTEILSYLNRLSDLFFILARKHAEGKEVVI